MKHETIKSIKDWNLKKDQTEQTNTCLKFKIEALEEDGKYVQI